MIRIVSVVTVYVALLIGGFSYLWIADKQSRYCGVSWWNTKYLARRDLPANHRLSMWDLRKPRQYGSPEAPVSDDTYVGKYLVREVKAECPVDSIFLGDTPNLVVSEGNTLVPYSLQNKPGLADVLQPGDPVGLFAVTGSEQRVSPRLTVVALVEMNESDTVLLEAPPDPLLLDPDFIANSVLVIGGIPHPTPKKEDPGD